MFRLLILSISALLITSCATGYAEKSWLNDGGYSETRLSENVWKVKFLGNDFTSSEMAADYSILRAAELCNENNYSYFVLVTGKDWTNTDVVTVGNTTSNTYGTVDAYGNVNATTTTTQPTTMVFDWKHSENTVMGLTEKAEGNGIVYESAFVINSIKNKYKMNEEK